MNAPAFVVRKRHLDGLNDAPRARGERRFEQLWAVGREYEKVVGHGSDVGPELGGKGHRR